MDQFSLQANTYHLENEKKNLIKIMTMFIDNIDMEKDQFEGRPRVPMRDIIKSLLVMSYHGWSYRRSNSDIDILYEKGVIGHKPSRASLNKYMLEEETEKLLERLIQLSSLTFADVSETFMIDSTWYSKFMRVSYAHKQRVRQLPLPPLGKTRKLHVGYIRESGLICWARGGPGTEHDHNHFGEALKTTIVQNKFRIRTVLADSAYNSKENFCLCEELGVKRAFLDFKKNHTQKRSKSKLRRDMFNMYHQNPEEWHEFYRFRQSIEGNVFSVSKRKNISYIRSRIPTAQNCELLLKALWFNLTVLAKHYY